MTAISVIVPCRNEAAYVDAFLQSVLAQRLAGPEDSLEVVVADGMSDDGTREQLEGWRHRDARLVVVDNPARMTSAALNRALELARGEFIVRMDVHTTYDSDYVARCVAVLRATGATCVGGPWRPSGSGRRRQAIARAFASPIGSGGAASRNLDYSGPVDTVYLGAWRRADLVRLGGFDETLVRNQDDELCLRIIRSGGSVWQCATIRSYYESRDSLAALLRQFYQYGYWKVAVILKHRIAAAARQLMPFVFVATLAVLLVLAPFLRAAALTFVVIIASYATVVIAAAWLAAGLRGLPTTALAIAFMHVGYGIGFGRGLLDLVVLRRGPAAAMTRLTR